MNYFDWLFDEQRRLFLEMKWAEIQRLATCYVVAYSEEMRRFLANHPERLTPGAIIPMQSRGELKIIQNPHYDLWADTAEKQSALWCARLSNF